MLACSKTCFGTGRSLLCICNHVVAECCDFLLSKKCFVTNRALLTFGKTCFGTCSSLSSYDLLGVAKSLDHLRSSNFIFALSICEHLSAFAGEIFFQAGLYACCGFSVYLGKRMLVDVMVTLTLVSTGANLAIKILTATAHGASALAIMELSNDSTRCHSKNQRKHEQKQNDLFHSCFLQ